MALSMLLDMDFDTDYASGYANESEQWNSCQSYGNFSSGIAYDNDIITLTLPFPLAMDVASPPQSN